MTQLRKEISYSNFQQFSERSSENNNMRMQNPSLKLQKSFFPTWCDYQKTFELEQDVSLNRKLKVRTLKKKTKN